MHESICLSVDLDLRHERKSVQVFEHLFSCGKTILFPSLMGNLAAVGIPQKDFALGLQSFEHHEFMVSEKHFYRFDLKDAQYFVGAEDDSYMPELEGGVRHEDES